MAATIIDGVAELGRLLFGEQDAYVYEEDVLEVIQDSPLTPLQIDTLAMRYGLYGGGPVPFKTIANVQGVTDKSVQQTNQRALEAIQADGETMRRLGELFGVDI